MVGTETTVSSKTTSKPKGGGTKSSSNKGGKGGGAAAQEKPKEYNPRWKGYSLMCITSLITLSSVSSNAVDTKFAGHLGWTLAWCALTFTICFIILFLDRTQYCFDRFNYTKARDGNLEGWVLLTFVIFWIVGVSFITQVNGVGYLTLNTYFGSWLTLVASIYTLNKWSTAKDILSIHELTGVSNTLKSWYATLITSLVVLGTTVNYMAYFISLQTDQADAAVCVALSFVSVLVSLFWICVHYNFITIVSQGGWAEVLIAVAIVLCWIVMVALATAKGGIGSTIAGTHCPNISKILSGSDNCTIVVLEPDGVTSNIPCIEVAMENEIPGSNIYVFTWLGLVSAVSICFKWKAQQALQFAQTQQDRLQRNHPLGQQGQYPSQSNGNDNAAATAAAATDGGGDEDDEFDDILDELDNAD